MPFCHTFPGCDPGMQKRKFAAMNEAFDQLQQELAGKINLPQTPGTFVLQENDLVFTLDGLYKNGSGFIACDVVAWPDTHLGTFGKAVTVTGQYEPGYFAFYEGPMLIDFIRELCLEKAWTPRLVIVDGHGLAHPRKFGLACYVGLTLDVAAIGCAKSTLLPYTGTPDMPAGSQLPVLLGNETVGCVLRTQEGINPVFVSVGNGLHLDDAVHIIRHFVKTYRQAEPMRRADQFVRSMARTAGFNE